MLYHLSDEMIFEREGRKVKIKKSLIASDADEGY
jgi:hypothetical protein